MSNRNVSIKEFVYVTKTHFELMSHVCSTSWMKLYSKEIGFCGIHDRIPSMEIAMLGMKIVES